MVYLSTKKIAEQNVPKWFDDLLFELTFMVVNRLLDTIWTFGIECLIDWQYGIAQGHQTVATHLKGNQRRMNNREWSADRPWCMANYLAVELYERFLT